MPYASNTNLPPEIKNALPEEAQTTWRGIVNSALTQYGDEGHAFATAWAALRRAGWDKIEGKWTKVHKEDDIHTLQLFDFKIQKALDEKKLAFGWAMWSTDKFGTPIRDLQNDMIDPVELESLAYRFVRLYREAGEKHIKGGSGVLVESVVFTTDKMQAMGIPPGILPIGWWVGFYVTDPAVWEAIKSGKYRSFSIEGSAIRREI